jgi:hypothetical protein
MAGTPTAPWNFGSRATRHDLRAQVPRQSAGPSKDGGDQIADVVCHCAPYTEIQIGFRKQNVDAAN